MQRLTAILSRMFAHVTTLFLWQPVNSKIICYIFYLRSFIFNNFFDHINSHTKYI